MKRVWLVRDAEWKSDARLLIEVRTDVFVEEQGVDIAIERDGKDSICHHTIALDLGGQALGTGRLSEDGKIGRVAVLKDWRGLGVGAEIMKNLILQSQTLGMTQTYLHSQVSVVGFYESLGYQQKGSIFKEAGIPHVVMLRESNNT